MALEAGKLAIVVVAQPIPGVTPNALTDLIGNTNLFTAEGLVLGDSGSGIGESGIDYTLTRNQQPVPNVNADLTRQQGNLLDREVSNLSFAFPVAGNKKDTAATPVDSDFSFATHLPGVEAIYRSCGLYGTDDPSGVGTIYSPGATQFVSIGIWDSGSVYIFNDCMASLSMSWTAGEIGVQTATWLGKLDATNTQTTPFPNLNYAEQATVGTPTAELAANVFGPTRGWSTCSIEFNNGIQFRLDCNQDGGRGVVQDTREITLSSVIDIDSTDLLFDYDNLGATDTAGLDQFQFGVGTPAVGSDPALAYQVTVPTLQNTEIGPAQQFRYRSTTLTADVVSDQADQEIAILFR